MMLGESESLIKYKDLIVPLNQIPYLSKHNNQWSNQRQHYKKRTDSKEIITLLLSNVIIGGTNSMAGAEIHPRTGSNKHYSIGNKTSEMIITKYISI